MNAKYQDDTFHKTPERTHNQHILRTSNEDNISPSNRDEKIIISNSKDISWYPRVLVIGPGGIKGLKVLGFLSTLEDAGLLEYVDTYGGVSIGAIISLLIICGYEIREIIGEASKFDIFKELGAFNFKSVIENKGLISNEPSRKILTQLVINKFGNVPSLKNLYMRTGKSFTTVTLNATDEKCVLMDPFTHPDVSCVDATMFSMNIPFLFYQLVYRGKIYVDGALANPYPVDYFDDGNTNILGIYMKTSNTGSPSPVYHHVPGTIIQKIDEPSVQISMGTYALKVIHSLMDQRRNHIIQNSSVRCKHVCLQTTIIDSVGYSVTIEDKALMLVEGFNEGKDFISQIKNNAYKGPKIPDKLKYKYPTYYMYEYEESEIEDSRNDDHIEILKAMNS
jgi:predicted acylesterase/phospholipase RssA/Txe/YoeB family toxin of Txe-Axe toxin-antitoxin module